MPRCRRASAAPFVTPRLALRLALGLSILAAAAAPAAAQDAPPAGRSRSAAAATLLGVVFPGGGHYYAGEGNRGALITAGTLLSLGIAAANFEQDCYAFGEASACEKGVTAAGFFTVLGAAVWVYGAVDAHNAVRREAARRARVSIRPTIRPATGSPTALGIVASAHVAF